MYVADAEVQPVGGCKNRSFRIKQVSHRNQEFLRGRNIGTQIADSRWKSLQSWLPKNVKTLYRNHLNAKLTCDHGSTGFKINICTEIGSTQNEEWRLKTKKQRKHVGFESHS